MSGNYNHNNTDKRIDIELRIFEAINHKIEHEDNLFVSRITWFISLQALLFFPVFLIFSQTAENSKSLIGLSKTFFRHQENLLLGIILTGLFFCFIVLLGCQAGHFRINQLVEVYEQRKNQFHQIHSDYFHLILDVQSPTWVRFFCLLASFGSIFIFSKLWLFLEIIANINQNIIILSFITVTIIDWITISNLFDCLFNFLHFDKSQKFFTQILLGMIVIAIELFICLVVGNA